MISTSIGASWIEKSLQLLGARAKPRTTESLLAACLAERSGANERLAGVRPAVGMAAQGCHRVKNALGAFYRRIQARGGGPKAVVATARKLAERVYRMLKYGQAYVRVAQDAYDAQYQDR